METTIAQLKKGQKAIIKHFDIEAIPLKLIEMGCLPSNVVKLLEVAPFGDPLFLSVNESHLAIRLETAAQIFVELLEN